MISNEHDTSAALGRLLTAARARPKLDAEAEARLLEAAARGDDEAASRLVAAHLGELVCLARRFACKGLPLEDLVHEGALGLLEAARRYDPRHGTRFMTYGAFFARRSMVAALARSAKTIRVPRHFSARLRRVRDARDRLCAAGRDPSPENLAGLLGVSPDEARELDRLRSPYEVSTDEPLPAAAGVTRGEMLPDTRQAPPDERHELREQRRELHAALATLPERERAILAARHGLGGRPPLTLRELGAEMSLSKERVRQLEERAKLALRERLAPRLFATPAGPPA